MVFKRAFILLAFCLFAFPVQAELSQYLENEIAVDSQSQSERRTALRTLFSQSIVRVTGRVDAPDNSVINNAIQNASSYVIQFGYRNVDGQLMLRASFDQRRVLELLDEAGLTAWTSQRPTVLLWIATRGDDGATDILSRDTNNTFIDAIQQRAQLRGFPIFFPLMDLTDRMVIEPRDVWGRFDREVREASDRYPADAVVMGRLERTVLENEEQGYRLGWQLLNDAIRTNESFEGETPETVAEQLADYLFSLLAEAFVVDSESDELNQIQILVTNTGELSALLDAERVLTRAGVVRSSRLKHFRQGQALFEITVSGPLQRYLQMLALERNLEVAEEIDPDQIPEQLEFRWAR